jgi:hypothetical protein
MRERASPHLVEGLNEPLEVRVALDKRDKKEVTKARDSPSPVLTLPEKARHVVQRVGDGLRLFGVSARREQTDPDETPLK